MTGLDGNLVAVAPSTGGVVLQLPDLKGNVGATAVDSTTATGVSATYGYTEFGLAESGVTDPTVYGALGGQQRSSNDLGGLSLMGHRLYDPTSGRFLQVDPVPGGSANRYDYCDQDPIDGTDLTGQWHWHHHWRRWFAHHFDYAGLTVGVGFLCFGPSVSFDLMKSGYPYVTAPGALSGSSFASEVGVGSGAGLAVGYGFRLRKPG